MADRSSARPRGVTVSLVVAGVLFAAGCTGSGDGEAASTSSATSSSAATATSAPSATTTAAPSEASALPPLPDSAKENTPEGAEAFIRYYFDVTNDLYMEPVEGVVPELSHPECVACQRTEDTIAQLASSNSRARTEPFTLEAMQRIGGGPPGVQRFDMVADAPANATVDADGNESNVGTAETVAGIGAAYWDGERWTLYDLALTPQ
jgi:hypothetical protein